MCFKHTSWKAVYTHFHISFWFWIKFLLQSSNFLVNILFWKDPGLVQTWYTAGRLAQGGKLLLFHACCRHKRCENSLGTGKCCGITLNIYWCANRIVPPGSNKHYKTSLPQMNRLNWMQERIWHLGFCCGSLRRAKQILIISLQF